MELCERCGRHHRVDEASCPFCETRVARPGRLISAVVAAASSLVLVACYGQPPDPYQPVPSDTPSEVQPEVACDQDARSTSGACEEDAQ